MQYFLLTDYYINVNYAPFKQLGAKNIHQTGIKSSENLIILKFNQ